ncbi:MAG: hypothetical protein LRZ88_01320 [Candidatus Cloacimonetes bacterium]|nr:hypothetical protein [Candidatus Cloacimonadota bacterium]
MINDRSGLDIQGLTEFPLRSSYYELHDFNSVSISFVAGDSDTSDSYPVALESAKGLPDLVLLNVVTYGEARKQALLIGDFVGYPVRDCTTDNAQELQEQVQAPQAITRPQMPAGGRIELIENENELIVNTRVSKSRMASSLMACIPLIFFLIFSYRFIGILFSRGTPWIVRAFFLTFFWCFLHSNSIYRIPKEFTQAWQSHAKLKNKQYRHGTACIPKQRETAVVLE